MKRLLFLIGFLIPPALCLGAVVLTDPLETNGFIANAVGLCILMLGLSFVCCAFYILLEPDALRFIPLLFLLLGIPALTLFALNQSYREEAAIEAAASRVLTGTLHIINADMVEIAGETVKLHGIHAPALGQTCLTADGTPWRCGMIAAQALADHVEDQPVSCEGQYKARKGLLQAVCRVDGADLSRWLVREGYVWARAGSDYIPDEDAARKARRGLWQLPFAAERGRPER